MWCRRRFTHTQCMHRWVCLVGAHRSFEWFFVFDSHRFSCKMHPFDHVLQRNCDKGCTMYNVRMQNNVPIGRARPAVSIYSNQRTHHGRVFARTEWSFSIFTRIETKHKHTRTRTHSTLGANECIQYNIASGSMFVCTYLCRRTHSQRFQWNHKLTVDFKIKQTIQY